jgi:hypothetical protein
MEQTADGGCVMVGSTLLSGAGGWDFWLLKADADGDSQWSRTFGGYYDDVCCAVLQTRDRGYVLAGYTASFGAGGYDFWLVRTDSLGDSLWSHTFGGNEDEVCTCAQKTADEGYILGGITWSYSVGLNDIWLVKTDANGDSLWSRRIGGSDGEICYSIRQTADGGFILGGVGDGPTPASYADAWLLKTDAVGDCLWLSTFGGPANDICHSVQVTMDGGYVLATNMSLGNMDQDARLIRTNADGDSLWSLTLGSPRIDFCYDVRQTMDGGFVVGGGTEPWDSEPFDTWLVKTGPELSVRAPPLTRDFTFLTNYPNPFNLRTIVQFAVPRSSRVIIRAYDILGREVGTISDDFYAPGQHLVPWECRNCASGTYWISMTGDGFQLVRKTILLR